MNKYPKAFEHQGIIEFEAVPGEKWLDQYSPSGIFILILKGEHL